MKWLALDEEREAGAKAPPRKTQVQVKWQPEADAVTQDPGVQRQPPHNFHTPATKPAEKKATPDTKTATTQDGVTLGLLPAQTALLTSLGTAERDDLSQLTAEIRRLWKDDPQKAEALIKDLTLHLTLVDPERPQEYITTAEILQARTRLQEELESTQAAYAESKKSAEAAGQAQARAGAQARLGEAQRAPYLSWQPLEDANGHPNSTVRVDPKSGRAVLWDVTQNRPATDLRGKAVELDGATLDKLEGQGLFDLATANQTLQLLREGIGQAYGGVNVGAEKLGEIARALDKGFEHLSVVAPVADEIENMIQRGDFDRGEAEQLLERIDAVVSDPATIVKQQEIRDYFNSSSAGDIEQRAEKRGQIIVELDDLYGDLQTYGQQIAHLVAKLKAAGHSDEEIAKLAKQNPAAAELQETFGKIAEQQIALVLYPEHPHPDLDPQGVATLKWLENKQFVGENILLFAGESLATMAIGLVNPLAAALIAAGLAGASEQQKAGSSLIRAQLAEAGIDLTNPAEIDAYVKQNYQQLLANERKAISRASGAVIASLLGSLIGDMVGDPTGIVDRVVEEVTNLGLDGLQ